MTDRLPFLATQASVGYDGLSTLPVSVILHDVRSLYNVGAFFRTMDATRCERLYLSGITGHPPHRAISKTALGAEETVDWRQVADPQPLLAELRALNYEIAAIETSVHAVDLFDWQPNFPVALLFGHEVEGLTAGLLAACDTHVRIPMLGRKHSLNVATAGGVVIYELLRKRRVRT